jgi:hypothetical protein
MNRKNFVVRSFPSLSDFAFLAPAVLLFAVMAGTANMLADADTGWHIRAGDWILDHHRLPTTDFFSFTKVGQPWFAWEWLWEVSFAWLHRSAGMAGVILASVLVVCLTSALLFRFVRRQCTNDLIAFAVTVLAVFGLSLHFLARPHLFSFLFAVILLDLLERRRQAGRDVPWAAIPLIVLWANVHPGFAAGIIILAAYTAGELVAALTSSKADERKVLLKRFQRYLLLTAACAVAPLANPYGYRLFVHMYSFLSDPYALHHVAEYQVVDFRIPPGRAFELMLLLGAPAALTLARRRQFAPLVLFAGWAHLALTAQRNVPFFMIVAAAPVAIWLEQVLAVLTHPSLPDSIRRAAAGFQRVAVEFRADDQIPRFHLISIAAMVLIFLLLRAPGAPPKFQPHYDRAAYPEGALSALRQMSPSARIFTTDVWGGYLVYRLYPNVRVFWDGRVDFYGTPYNQAAVDTAMGGPHWSETLAEHRITAALVPVNLPLTSLLTKSKDWQVVYRDKTAVLFQVSQPITRSSVSFPRVSRSTACSAL